MAGKDSSPTRDLGAESLAREADSPLPPVAERLARLRPSRELLEFYRQKLAQYDTEHEELLHLLEKHGSSMEEQHKLQCEVRQREEELSELQKALSDVQVFLLQEREQALRLYAENDRLKIRELEDRKKIQHLLALVGPDAGEITYFHRQPPHQVTIPQKKVQPRPQGQQHKDRPAKVWPAPAKESARGHRNGGEEHRDSQDSQLLLLQVQALQAQMEEQTRLGKEQVEALMEDRRILREEQQVQQHRDQERISALTDRLRRVQALLQESTRRLLTQQRAGRAQEAGWMAEKAGLLQQLDLWQERGREGRGSTAPRLAPPVPEPSSQPSPTQREETRALEDELKQAHRLADMYREQCISMETELAQMREQGDVGREIFRERSEKMAGRLQQMTQRCEVVERRRVTEAQGFRSDIKLLRQKLRDVEKQLFKVAMNVGPDQDLAILHEVRQTNGRTKRVQDELKVLKAKMYGLENQLRFC